MFNLQFPTRSNTLTLPSWEWTLTFHVGQNVANMEEELKVVLIAIDVDHSSRSLEFLLMIHDETKILRTIVGTKMFTKSRQFFFYCYHQRLYFPEMLFQFFSTGESNPFLSSWCTGPRVTFLNKYICANSIICHTFRRLCGPKCRR